MSESGDATGWRASSSVHGYDLAQLATCGSHIPVVTRLLKIAAGDLQLAMRIGEDGAPTSLSLQAASQRIVQVHELLERLQLASELGGHET